MVGCNVTDNILSALMIWVKPPLVTQLAGQPVTLVEPRWANNTELTVVMPKDLEKMYTDAHMEIVKDAALED